MIIQTRDPPRVEREARKVPSVNWDALTNPEKAKQFSDTVDAEMKGLTATSDWPALTKLMNKVGKDVCGAKDKTSISPWIDAHTDEVERYQRDIVELTKQIKNATGYEEIKLRIKRESPSGI